MPFGIAATPQYFPDVTGDLFMGLARLLVL